MFLFNRFFCSCLLLLFLTKASAQNCTLAVDVTASSAVLCAGSTVTLTAQPTGGAAPYTYSWSTGETTQTINISAAGTYTVAVTDNTPGCGPASKGITINNPNFLRTNEAFICAGTSATLTASGADSYQWFTDAAATNQVSSQATYVTPPLNEGTNYYVVGYSNGCRSLTTAVAVNVVPLPAAPVANSVAICSGTATTLSASSPTGSVFDWYATATGGQSLITSPDFTTPVLTATTTYYVQTYNGACAGPRAAVTVTVNPRPVTPVASGQTVCYNSGAALTVTNAASISGTINWYDSSFGNIPVFTGSIFNTPALAASTTYYVEATNQFGCSSSRIAVIAAVRPQIPHPTAPGTIVCSGSAANLTATSTQAGSTFDWYDDPTAGNKLFTGANFTTPALTGNTSYYVQSTYMGCVGPRTKVDVTVTAMPAAPTVTGVTTVCAGNSTVLTATGSGTDYMWYDAATGGNLLASTATFTTPPVTANVTYYVQTVNGQCSSSRVSITITAKPTPAAPAVSGNTATVCPGSSATLTATGTNITWFDAATGGNVLATGNSFTTPALNATNTYYAESSNGDCSSTRSPATVTVYTIPDPILKYSQGTYCKVNTTNTPAPTVNLSPYASKTFTGDAGLVFSNAATGAVSVALSSPGAHVVTVTFTGNPCVSSATATINISTGAGSATFSYPQAAYCQYDANPSPIFPSGSFGGTFTSNSAGLVFVDNTTGQIDLSASAPGTYIVRNTLSCSGTTSTFTLTVNARPVVNAGPDQNLALNTPAQLAGSVQSPIAVKWTGGTGSFNDASKLNAIYTPGTGETSATLTLTSVPAAGAPCGPLSDQVVINYGPLALPTVAGTSICAGATAILNATAPGGDYQWYDAAVGGNLLYSGNPLGVTPSVTTTYYVQTTLGGITSGRTPVTVMVNATPKITVTGNTTCFDTQATLTATVDIPGSGGTFQWYNGNGALLATGPTYTTTYLQQNTIFL